MRKWATVVFLVVAGCSFNSSNPQTIENSCVDDASCPVGVCDRGICIDDTGASVEVAIEVLRDESNPQGTTPASWAFPTQSFSGASTRDLVLPATRQVRGLVLWKGLSVPATLRFVRRMSGSVAPLKPVPVEVETLRDTAGGDTPDAYDFSVVLVAGETYDVVVLPSSDMVMAPAEAPAPAIRSLPPLYLELVVDDGDSTEPVRFDVVFPPELDEECTDSVATRCTLVAQVLSSDGEEEVPEPGLQVRAITRDARRVVSSIGETDETGRFAIRIGDAGPGYLIRVTSSVGRDPFPAVSVDPAMAFEDDPNEKTIYIPRLNRVQFSGQVRDQNDRPVPGATARFLSDAIFDGSELGLEGSFGGSATTSEDGRFSVELLPGLYLTTVTPPEDVENSWGMLSTEVLVSENLTSTDTFIVPSQIGLRGSVTTFAEEAAAGVTVLARARLGADPNAIHRSQEVVSDALGGFAMSVDSGLYDMHLKVPSETGFGWLVEPELAMSLERGDLARDYRLEPPIPIYGVVRTSTGDAVPNAMVRAHVMMVADGTTTRAIQVADTASEEDGSYRLLIAPDLDDQ